MSEDVVDLSPLITSLSSRVDKNKEKVRASIAKARKEEATKLKAVAGKRKDKTEKATSYFAKTAEVAPECIATEAAAGASAPRPPAPVPQPTTPKKACLTVAKKHLASLPGREGIVKCKQFMDHLCLRHQEDTVRMLKDAAKKGLRTVPVGTLNPMRVKRIDEMKNVNSQLEILGSTQYDQAALTEKLVQAEQEATKAFIKEAKQAAAGGEKRKSARNDSTASPKRQRKSSYDTISESIVLNGQKNTNTLVQGPNFGNGGTTNNTAAKVSGNLFGQSSGISEIQATSRPTPNVTADASI